METTTALVIELRPEPVNNEQVKQLAMHGKTMIMMYQATGEVKYLDRANADYHRAKSLLRSGSIVTGKQVQVLIQ